MNYLSVESLSKSFGNKILFENINFGISQGQRVALIARNGAGKTTLLKLIMGLDSPDTGNIALRKEITVTWLDQHPVFDDNHTVAEDIYNTRNPIFDAIRIYEESLTFFENEPNESNAQKLQEASGTLDRLEAWGYEAKVKEILSRLNIAFLDKKIGLLSGGQKKRVALAKVLINEPDLLILDEPTNQLDVEMIEWLEEYLINNKLTIFLVTHDRYFLDSVCTEIIEMENSGLYHYKGNFQYFVQKKAEREQVENSEIDKAKNLYRRELEWVRRMPKARGTKAKYRVDAFSETEEKAFSKRKDEKLELTVKMTRMGGKILEMKNISKSYSDLVLVKNFSYIFKKGEKVGIVGKNGVGKTTLLNMIMGLKTPDSGEIEAGETMVFGYYTQDGLILDEDKRVIEVVKDIADFIPLADGNVLTASQLLFRFQFPADVQHSFVSKLSGGEKRKLYLLTVLMKNPNFLILDEPTNDLDILTLSVLEDFLTTFQGCVLIVTHDRYFMDKMVDHLFVFEGEGKIRDFPGNYTQYRDKIEDENRVQKSQLSEKDVKKEISIKNLDAPKVKLTFKEKLEFEQLEKEIEQLENEKADITIQMNLNNAHHDDIINWSVRIGEIMALLDVKSNRWLELSEFKM